MYVALIDAITSVLIANYSDRTLIMDRCGIPALTLFHYLCCVLPAAKVEQLLCGALAALVGSYGQWGAPDAPKLRLSALDQKVQIGRQQPTDNIRPR